MLESQAPVRNAERYQQWLKNDAQASWIWQDRNLQLETDVKFVGGRILVVFPEPGKS